MILPIPVGVDVELRSLPRAAIAILVVNLVVFVFTRADTRIIERDEAKLERLARWELEKAGELSAEVGIRSAAYPRALDFLAADPTWERLVVDDASRDRLRRYLTEHRALTATHVFFRYGFVPADVTPLRLLVYPFLHADFLHLAFNMLFFWVVAAVLEDRLGAPRFVLLYFASAGAAAAAHWAWIPTSGEPAIGASGAVAGLMGAFALLFTRTRIHVVLVYALGLMPRWRSIAVPAWLFLGAWILEQFFWATLTHKMRVGIAFWAHVGGFAGGVASALALSGFQPFRGSGRSAPARVPPPRRGSRRPGS